MMMVDLVYGSPYSAGGMGGFLLTVFLVQGVWANIKNRNFQNLSRFLIGFCVLALLCGGAWWLLLIFSQYTF
jgi:high-affinity Fe2+/Pb2+ permease